MAILTGLKNEKELDKAPSFQPSKADQEAMDFHFDRFEKARAQRQQQYEEFDDQDYASDYRQNELTMNTYLRKKRNDDEVRVNTGTSEKKVESIMTELLALNLQPEIHAYDREDREIAGLGRDMEDLVRRTNEIERDDDFWVEFAQELVSQRAVFVEEEFVENAITDKRRGKKAAMRKLGFARKRVRCGLNVFLGDITIPAYRFDEQPYIFTYDRFNYWMAKQQFDHLPNFKYVKPGFPKMEADNYGAQRFGSLERDEVGILAYQSYPDDDYQIYIQNVPMLKIGEQLPWEHEGYNIKMFVLKSLSRKMAYGRSMISAAKTLQALENETIRNLIRKFRQALEPPLGVPGGKVYSRDIWAPGAMVQGVTKDNFSRLIDHNGVTPSEMQMFEMINTKVEEFIGRSDIAQGLPGPHQMTATQAIEMQRQAAKNLGLSVLAMMRAKRELTILRAYTFLENYLDPIGKRLDPVSRAVKKMFRKFTVLEANIDEGKLGRKEIQLTNEAKTPSEMEELKEREDIEAAIGKPFRWRGINIELLRTIPQLWHVTVHQAEKESSALNKVLFQDQTAQAVQISQIAQRPLNADKLIERFEDVWRIRGLFQRAPEMMAGQLGGVQGEAEQLLGQINQLGTAEGGQVRQGAVQGQTARPGARALLAQPA